MRGIVGDCLDILVLNAGVSKAATIEDTTVEDFDKLLAAGAVRNATGGSAEGPVAAQSTTRSATQASAALPNEPEGNPAANSSILILTTLPERGAAEALARELLTTRLAACIQIGATAQSLYHWRGEIETA